MTSRLWRIALTGTAATLFFPLCYAAASYAPVSRGFRTPFALLVGVLLVFLLGSIVRYLYNWSSGSVSMTAFFTHKNAEKVVIISHVQSMIAAGYHTKAASEIEKLITANGLDPKLCQMAVDFHLGKFGNLERAESLLREMRIQNPAAFELYATQRLVDLYMKRVETHPRARSELQRIVGLFPGTVEARGALACIAQLRELPPATVA
jgi:hypothetical protein